MRSYQRRVRGVCRHHLQPQRGAVALREGAHCVRLVPRARIAIERWQYTEGEARGHSCCRSAPYYCGREEEYLSLQRPAATPGGMVTKDPPGEEDECSPSAEIGVGQWAVGAGGGQWAMSGGRWAVGSGS